MRNRVSRVKTYDLIQVLTLPENKINQIQTHVHQECQNAMIHWQSYKEKMFALQYRKIQTASLSLNKGTQSFKCYNWDADQSVRPKHQPQKKEAGDRQ